MPIPRGRKLRIPPGEVCVFDTRILVTHFMFLLPAEVPAAAPFPYLETSLPEQVSRFHHNSVQFLMNSCHKEGVRDRNRAGIEAADPA
eukprot:gene25963-biopygen12358